MRSLLEHAPDEVPRLAQARETAARRAERLVMITGAIAEAVTAAQVYAAVVDQVAAALGASSAGLWVLDAESRCAQLARSIGYPEAAARALDGVPLDRTPSFPALDAMRTGEALWIDSQAELVDRYPHLAGMVTSGRAYAICCLPLVVDRETTGSIGFTFDDAPPPDADQRSFLLLAARYSAQALGRLRLLESEQRSRERAERSAARLAILSRASRAFAEAGSVDVVIGALTREVANEIAHSCAVTLISEGGELLELAAIAHHDRDGEALVRSLLGARPIRLGEGLNGGVAATGVAIMVRLERAQLAASLPAEYHPWLERYPLESAIVVPLRARGEVLGTLCAIREEGAQPFDDGDRDFLQEIAERAATALERSQLARESERSRARAELLYELAGAANDAEHVSAVYRAALDAIARATGARRSAILARDAEGVMRFEAQRGLSDDYRRAVEGHSPWAPDERAPQPIFVPDVRDDPALEHFLPLFAREGILSLGFIPLTAGGALVGKLMIYYDAPRALAAHELELAQAIASHVAVAISRFRAVAELRESVRFNEMFTGMLGHDLRNPLAAIMTVAQLLKVRGAPEVVGRPVDRILHSGARMARMIDQLLDFTRVRVGAGVPLWREPVDLTALLRHVIDELAQAHPRCRIVLEPPSSDAKGPWDADRLAQVFSNLVGNAVQHGSAGAGVQVRVLTGEADRVRVIVHNQGAIPAELLPMVFEPMSGGSQRRDGSRGLGLGLYITREIVKAHGGAIDVRSSDAEGTTFEVVLPRSPEAR